MKRILKTLLLFFSINTSLLVIPESTNAQTIGFQVFYDDLSPYGTWIESPQYGYVWSPRVNGFTPYATNGYWAFTDYGWTWVSGYSWGWAPFHYGRWYHDPFYGYVWVPGYEWGPGWVTWRRSGDYYGWAPIGPGVSINLAYSNSYNLPYHHWNFVRCNDFGRRDIHNYYIDRSRNVTIVNNTTVINNTKVDNTRNVRFNTGPNRMEVQKRSGRTIAPVAVVEEKTPGQRVTKNSVQLYRPLVKNESVNSDGKRPAPATVVPQRNVKANARKLTEQAAPAVKDITERNDAGSQQVTTRRQVPADNKNEVQQARRDDIQQERTRRNIERQQPENIQPGNTNIQRAPAEQRTINEPVRQTPGREERISTQQPQREQQNERPRPVIERQQQPERPQPNMERPRERERSRPNFERSQQRERPQPQMNRPQPRQMERSMQQPASRPQSPAGRGNRPAR